MNNNFRGKDIINLRDMTPEEFRYLLDLAHFLLLERIGVYPQSDDTLDWADVLWQN